MVDSPFARFAVLELGEHPTTALCGSHLGALGMRVTAYRPLGSAGAVSAARLGYDWCKQVREGVPEGAWHEYDVVLDAGCIPLDPSHLAPGVVWCQVSGDGQAPAASVPENIAQARTGLAGYVGSQAEPPIRVGAPVVTFSTAVAAAEAILAALLRWERHGIGATVGVSMLRTALALLGNNVTSESDHDARIGFARGPWMAPERGFACRDGTVDLVFLHDNGGFARFCEWLGLPELAEDPRFKTYPMRGGHPAELAEALAPALSRRSVAEVLERAGSLGALHAARERIVDLPRHPQLVHLGLLSPLDEKPAPGLPFRLNGSRLAAAPVRREAGEGQEPAPARSAGPARVAGGATTTRAPLTGMRVVDVTEGAQGPFAASLLADLGAMVVKVERPGGEFMRRVGPFKRGLPLPILSISRGRLASLELDLKQAGGRQAVLELVRGCDVFIENWRPGVARSLGLDCESLRAVNPALVYVSASGFGATGPMASFGCMDQIASAAGGLSSVSGADGAPGERTRFAMVDFMSAMVTAESALAALLARELSGAPQLAESSQLEATVAAVGPLILWTVEHGQDARPIGSSDRWAAPSFSATCADGAALAVHVETDDQWQALAAALDLAGEPAWERQAGRLADRPRVEAVVAAALARRTARESVAALSARGVPCAIVRRSVASAMDEDRALLDDHVVLRHSADAGWVAMVRPPWELDDTVLPAGWACPPLGRPAQPDWRLRWTDEAGC